MNRICDRDRFRWCHLAGLVVMEIGMMSVIGERAAAADRPTIGEIERLDPALDALVPPDAKMEIIVDGLDWCEGPLWIPADGGFLIFSVPNTLHFKSRLQFLFTGYGDMFGPPSTEDKNAGRICGHIMPLSFPYFVYGLKRAGFR